MPMLPCDCAPVSGVFPFPLTLHLHPKPCKEEGVAGLVWVHVSGPSGLPACFVSLFFLHGLHRLHRNGFVVCLISLGGRKGPRSF